MLNIGVLKDDTLIKIDYGTLPFMPLIHNVYNAKGMCLDQLIIADESQLESDLCKNVVLPTLVNSCVPDQFLIQVWGTNN